MKELLLLLLLLLLLILIILIINNKNNKNNSSKFGGTYLQKFIYNLTNSPLNVYSIVNQNKEYKSIDSTSNAQYYTTLRLYSSESTKYYYYYYGGGWGEISSDSNSPTVLTLNATGGYQLKNNADIGRYIRIFNNNTNNLSITPLLIYAVNSGNQIESGDAASVGFWKYISPTSSDGRTLPGPVIKSIGNSREVLGTYQPSQASLYSYTFNIGTWDNSNISNTTSRVCIIYSIPANGERIEKEDDYHSYGLHALYNYVNNIKINVPRYELINDFTKDDIISSTQVFRLILNVGTGGTGSGTVTSLLTGFNASTSSGDYGLFAIGTVLTIKADPNLQSIFSAWSGDASGNNSSLTITMDRDKTITATFNKKQYRLTIYNANNTGRGSVTVKKGNDTLSSNSTDYGLFDIGTVLTLTATPLGISIFSGWTGGVIDTGAFTGTITMDGDKIIEAIFFVQEPYILSIVKQGTGSGTVTVKVGDVTLTDYLIVDGTTGNYVISKYVEATITATPSEGSIFAGWSNDISSKDQILKIKRNSNAIFIATFNKKQYRLTINTKGTGGGSVTVKNGNTTLTSNSGDYGLFEPGTVLTLTATPSGTNIFAGWSDGASGNNSPLTITMDNNKSVMATFNLPAQIQYRLTIRTNGTGTGSVSTSQSSPYASGTVVTLIATPYDRYSSFAGWTSNVTPGTPLTKGTITMNSDQTVTATFNKTQYRLTLLNNYTGGTGTGTVEVKIGDNILPVNSDGYRLIDINAFVTLIATPTGGSIFSGWTGAISVNENPTSFPMNSNRTIAPKFDISAPPAPPAPIQYILTTGTDGTGSGTVEVTKGGSLQQKGPNGYAPFDINTKVTVKAIPTGESIFAGWSGAISKENSVNITMDDNKTVTAKFLANPSSGSYAQYNCPGVLAPGTY